VRKKYINFEEEQTISKYFKDVKKSSVLSQIDEIEIAKKIKNGDQKALNDLVKSNLKFVISIAKEYQGQGLPLSDLINEGNYGLIKAAHKFDHNRGFKFISYAVWWIKQSIIQSLNDNARMIRLPVNVINKIYLLKKEINKFENDNERTPVFGEISLNDSVIDYPKTTSLNTVINNEGDELIDLLTDNNDYRTYEDKCVEETKIKEVINKTLDVLDIRERQIIESYFGLNTYHEPMTLDAIGEKYGLTKERVRQVKNRALKKIRSNSFDLYNLLNK